jgi:hypothetical protein
MDPINYSGLLAQVDLRPLQQGLALRDQRQQIAQQREQQRRTVQLAESKFTEELNRNAEYRAALEQYRDDPTPEALRDLAFRFPEHQEALAAGAKTYTAEQAQDVLRTGASVLGSLAAGNTQLATDQLKRRRDGFARAGINTDQTDAIISLVGEGKIKEAQAMVAYAMSGLVGPDHMASLMDTLGVGKKAEDRAADNERQDRALDIRERATDATIARGEAASARAERAADRADRKAAEGGGSGRSGKGGKAKLPAGFILD